MKATRASMHQKNFRKKRRALGGVRLDTWLPPNEASILIKLSKWRSQTRPQVVLELIQSAWEFEVKKAAEAGYADALFELGNICIKNRQYHEAKNYLEESAEKGVIESNNNIGVLHWIDGKHKIAAEYFHRSIKKNNATSKYNLGILYIEGHGVTRNLSKAVSLFEDSAKNGFAPAYIYLGILYSLGVDCGSYSNEDAIDYLKKGLKESVDKCRSFLADIHGTDLRDEIRSGPKAVAIAEKLVKKRASVEHLNILAAAYAESDKYEEALRIQRKAIVKMKRKQPKDYEKNLEECEERIENYLRAKPWRKKNRFSGLHWYFDSPVE